MSYTTVSLYLRRDSYPITLYDEDASSATVLVQSSGEGVILDPSEIPLTAGAGVTGYNGFVVEIVAPPGERQQLLYDTIHPRTRTSPWDAPPAETLGDDIGVSGKKDAFGRRAGVIAGMAIGGILVLVCTLGGVYMFLRSRNKAKDKSASQDGGTTLNRESDKIAMDADESPRDYGGYMPGPQELSGVGQILELGPDHAYACATDAQELESDTQPSQIPQEQEDGQPSESRSERCSGTEVMLPARESAPQTSSDVEAQKRRELEWLEMEEAKLRQRRETLMRQAGHDL